MTLVTIIFTILHRVSDEYIFVQVHWLLWGHLISIFCLLWSAIYSTYCRSIRYLFIMTIILAVVILMQNLSDKCYLLLEDNVCSVSV